MTKNTLSQAATIAAAHIVSRVEASTHLLRMIAQAAGDLADGDAPSVLHATEALQSGAVRLINEALEVHREAARLAGRADGAQ